MQSKKLRLPQNSRARKVSTKLLSQKIGFPTKVVILVLVSIDNNPTRTMFFLEVILNTTLQTTPVLNPVLRIYL